MKLLESIDCEKGITLNSQLVDLLSILDENISQEHQDKKIKEYIENLRQKVEENTAMSSRGAGARQKNIYGKCKKSSRNDL